MVKRFIPVACVFAALLASNVKADAPSNIVNNIGLSINFTARFSQWGQANAQSFLTGPEPMLLHSVEFNTIDHVVGTDFSRGIVSLREDSAGVPGRNIASFNQLIVGTSYYTTSSVTAYGSKVLAPTSKYWVVVQYFEGDFSWALTSDSRSFGLGTLLDDDSFAGYGNSGWGDDTPNVRFQMRVKGYYAPVTRYVDGTGSNPQWPYLSLGTAATAIQTAIDVSRDGDTILVAPGTYETGGRIAGGSLPTNRVVIDKAIVVQSVNGPDVTTIVGRKAYDDSAVRGVWMTSGSSLIGFTVTNGSSLISGGGDELDGGGIWAQNTTAIISNCLLTGNSAGSDGGGAFRGTLNDCTLTNNSSGSVGGGASGATLNRCNLSDNDASDGAGGAWNCILNNCMLVNNEAQAGGGGADSSTLNNCTVTGNSTQQRGGGVSDSTLNNCIVYSNTAPSSPNHTNSVFNYSCTTPLPLGGTGNITNAPQFVDMVNGNFKLKSTSPCINVGNNASVSGERDLVGRARIIYGTVDMGAYEYRRTDLSWLILLSESSGP